MNSQTSLAAEQVRLRQWAEQIKDCNKRPNGMKVETWCSQNGITKANYYYRLRRVREAYLHSTQPCQPAFVEISHESDCTKMNTQSQAAAILHLPNDVTLEILTDASEDFIRRILGALSYVK